MSPTSTVHLLRPAPLALDAIEAERRTGGRWIGKARSVTVRGACLDSRRVSPGCIFVCIAGARADGHDFAAAAVGDGAALILASRPVPVPVPVLVVPDVARALAALAGLLRERTRGCTWIGVAGANGKTTTKELIAGALRAGTTAPVLVTQGNLNNHLGVPLTVLSLPERARYAVVELGSNHPGELAPLAAVVRPDLGCVVSIGPEHLEGFGDLAGVTREECSLFAALPAGAPCWLGAHGLAAQAAAHGTSGAALESLARQVATGRDLRISTEAPGRSDGPAEILATPAGEARLQLIGPHNRANAWLAWQVAVAAGVPGRDALLGIAAVRPVSGRLRTVAHQQHVILDDTYNANPASMEAGLIVLASRAGRRLAVLGHMGELGPAHDHGHRLVGEAVRRLGVDAIAVGPLATGIADAAGCPHAADRAAAITLARAWMAQGPGTILVKGSRSAKLEEVVAGLTGARP
jgi:UDP-N-acetylmuramoyl-tripeptide--D-alanyl-D-alanine ligase